jgi:hypothetical protein
VAEIWKVERGLLFTLPSQIGRRQRSTSGVK